MISRNCQKNPSSPPPNFLKFGKKGKKRQKQFLVFAKFQEIAKKKPTGAPSWDEGVPTGADPADRLPSGQRAELVPSAGNLLSDFPLFCSLAGKKRGAQSQLAEQSQLARARKADFYLSGARKADWPRSLTQTTVVAARPTGLCQG